jgi:hypothetical protein
MTTAEIVTTVLSVLALVVSLVTLYLTYFYEQVKLVGCLAKYWVDEPDSLIGVVFDFAFSNTGNKDLLIREAMVEVPQQPGAIVPEIECKEIPMVIKPDHVALINWRFHNCSSVMQQKRRRQ